MKRCELRDALEKRYGMTLKTKEVAEFLRIDRHNVRLVMEGYKVITHGQSRRWLAQDVAEAADSLGVMV